MHARLPHSVLMDRVKMIIDPRDDSRVGAAGGVLKGEWEKVGPGEATLVCSGLCSAAASVRPAPRLEARPTREATRV